MLYLSSSVLNIEKKCGNRMKINEILVFVDRPVSVLGWNKSTWS